jgi:predicted MFS family arabinose efflux permease
MISTMIFLTFGSILSALANHYILFLVARIICGYSGTVSAMAHCIYMAEISISNKRACNITLHQLGIASGLLFAVIATEAKNSDYLWRFTIGITSVPSMITCITTIIFLQRSPSFLLLKRVANSRVSVNNSWCYILETLIVMMIMLSLRQGTGRQQVLYYAPRLFALLGICSSK